MPSKNQSELTIWGRANSVNVQKVLWCLAELDLVYRRIDAGMAFGRNTEPDYLAMNPNARVPTLVEGAKAVPRPGGVFDPQPARTSTTARTAARRVTITSPPLHEPGCR